MGTENKVIGGVIVVLFVCVIIAIRYGIMKGFSSITEGFFNQYNRYYKMYCPSCGWRSPNTCGSCINCGLCISSDGSYECVPGDQFGPYFREDCAYWRYDYPYTYFYGSNNNNVYRVRYLDQNSKPAVRRPYSAYSQRGYYGDYRPTAVGYSSFDRGRNK